MSPEYSLETFCYQMRGRDPVAVIEAASAEISYARRFHREATKDSDFRKGSRGREYCENLQRLVSLVMNGSVPAGSTPEFLAAVKPLVHQLLERWEIGNLRQVFSNLQAPESLSLFSKIIKPLVLIVSRKEVEEGDISCALAVLKRLLESPEVAKSYQERVEIAFHGYDSDSRELYEIPEVRNFVYSLDNEFPYWLYFLSKKYFGLQALVLCFLPPFLTEEGKAKHFPTRIYDLLTERWLPALNHIGAFVGMSIQENETITDRTLQYISKGPLRIKGIVRGESDDS